MRTFSRVGLVALVLVTGCSAAHQSFPRPVARTAPTSVATRSGSAVELVAGGSPAPVPADRTAAGAVTGAEQRFALRMLQHVNGTRGTNNVTVSPLSLAVALAMLETGAAGRTLSEIATTLGTSALSASRQDAGWAWLTRTFARQSVLEGVRLESANSLWLERGLAVDPQFLSIMATYFATGVWQVDFSRGAEAASAIDRWVSSRTAGKITQLFGPGDINGLTRLVIANAVYFDAAWQDPFDPNRSEQGEFHPLPGETSQATYMEETVAHAAMAPGYEAVELPYRGGALEAIAVMPTAQNLDGFLEGLTVSQFDRIVASATQTAEVRLPRFTTTSYLQLDGALSAMGMPTIFTGAADFSGMSPIGLQVQSVVQRDYLSVGEAGTQAVAATGISMMPSAVAAPPTAIVTFDRPFLFAIRDVTTGTLVFTSVVHNPSE